LTNSARSTRSIWARRSAGPAVRGLRVLGMLRYYAGQATSIHGETIENSLPGEIFSYTLREPVGVVGAIIPWNGPLGASIWKIGPVPATGCTVVLKPAEEAPLTPFIAGASLMAASSVRRSRGRQKLALLGIGLGDLEGLAPRGGDAWGKIDTAAMPIALWAKRRRLVIMYRPASLFFQPEAPARVPLTALRDTLYLCKHSESHTHLMRLPPRCGRSDVRDSGRLGYIAVDVLRKSQSSRTLVAKHGLHLQILLESLIVANRYGDRQAQFSAHRLKSIATELGDVLDEFAPGSKLAWHLRLISRL
jgi:hypothetical protein